MPFSVWLKLASEEMWKMWKVNKRTTIEEVESANLTGLLWAKHVNEFLSCCDLTSDVNETHFQNTYFSKIYS